MRISESIRVPIFAAVSIALAGLVGSLDGSTIIPPDQHSWSENAGWMNWHDAGGGVDGVDVFYDHLRGFIWAENAGWINVGSGPGPYFNSSGADSGVNILPSGFCDGFAWGENIGWINFGTEPQLGVDGARFDFGAGRFRGYAWSENRGWINLDDSGHFVAAAPICCPGDANGDDFVDFDDINAALANWLAAYPGSGPGDANCDGAVDFNDINSVLGNWLEECP